MDRNLFSDYDPTPTLGEIQRRAVPDITASRHQGNPESVAAHESSPDGHSEQRERVFAFIKGKGKAGCTTWEASQELGIGYTSCSARFAELKRDLRIHANGLRRATPTGRLAAAMVVSQEMPNG